ncbi:MAG: DUF805 domain-containing protein [Mycobacteriales bacterium]
MSLAEAVKAVLGNYAGFSGRARRSEYWFWALALLVAGIVVGIVDAAIGSPVLGYLLDLAVLVPSLAVGVRRLHDTGKSGWWLLIGLVPLAGAIVLLVFFVTDSYPGDNQYGPSPKGAGEPTAGYGF